MTIDKDYQFMNIFIYTMNIFYLYKLKEVLFIFSNKKEKGALYACKNQLFYEVVHCSVVALTSVPSFSEPSLFKPSSFSWPSADKIPSSFS